jgi:hypothetical protein
MSHRPHELQDEFPEFAEKIAEMKQSNGHFARLAEEYDEINRRIHQAETHLAPVGELAEVEMRKKRVALKDELYRMLTES